MEESEEEEKRKEGRARTRAISLVYLEYSSNYYLLSYPCPYPYPLASKCTYITLHFDGFLHITILFFGF
jgi:hypothetical protein